MFCMWDNSRGGLMWDLAHLGFRWSLCWKPGNRETGSAMDSQAFCCLMYVGSITVIVF